MPLDHVQSFLRTAASRYNQWFHTISLVLTSERVCGGLEPFAYLLR